MSFFRIRYIDLESLNCTFMELKSDNKGRFVDRETS